MAEYTYPDDGRFHTRYSELSDCLDPVRALEVAERRAGLRTFRENDAMRFGKVRHEMFAEESQETGLTPQVFKDGLDLQFPLHRVEVTLATEILEIDGMKIVVWFTPDGEGDRLIVDYKTTSGTGSSYRTSVQMKEYTYLIAAGGHSPMPQHGHFMIEQWDPEREKIIDYHHEYQKLGLVAAAEGKQWIRPRVENLWAATQVLNQREGWTTPATSAIVTP